MGEATPEGLLVVAGAWCMDLRCLPIRPDRNTDPCALPPLPTRQECEQHRQLYAPVAQQRDVHPVHVPTQHALHGGFRSQAAGSAKGLWAGPGREHILSGRCPGQSVSECFFSLGEVTRQAAARHFTNRRF